MDYNYPLNYPEGVHLTVCDFTHLSPPPTNSRRAVWISHCGTFAVIWTNLSNYLLFWITCYQTCIKVHYPWLNQCSSHLCLPNSHLLWSQGQKHRLVSDMPWSRIIRLELAFRNLDRKQLAGWKLEGSCFPMNHGQNTLCDWGWVYEFISLVITSTYYRFRLTRGMNILYLQWRSSVTEAIFQVVWLHTYQICGYMWFSAINKFGPEIYVAW